MGRKSKIIFIVVGVLFVVAILLQLSINTQQPDTGAHQTINDPDLLEGKRLSEIHCSTCHKYPNPKLLPWRTWRFETLGAMAPFLGVKDPSSSGSSHDQRSNPYIPKNIYPSEPQVTQEEWQKIRNYYLYVAPQELAFEEMKPRIREDSLFFRASYPTYRPKNLPSVSAVEFDPKNKLIYLGDSNEKKLLVFNQTLDLINSRPIDSPLSQIEILNDTVKQIPRDLLLTFIGNFDPSDAPYGSVVRGGFDPLKMEFKKDSLLWDNLARPVESKYADLNKDGLKDLIVNEFGHRAGSLFWLENKGEGKKPEKRVLISKPGCIQSYVMDYNQNGYEDILALCSQTDQAVYLFENEGNGKFRRKTLLQFEVTAGSSSFEIHDFNDDGHPDILYTSGDNADFSQTFKPYHGVYIYLNDGKDQFAQKWFYHINGAYNAKARDFSGNGLLDIAVISYFSDYENRPEEGFIFFKNEGDFSFTPYHHPRSDIGRWLTMDVADWTGNGRDDIILANFPEGPIVSADSIKNRWERGPYFLLLENLSDEVE
ncbi:VCBS repeat-containing protein [Aliifodinibius sp. S!AR15-10]|uniref:FG-GAP repeat domain-containing protein n=1 Tax=Aliifodinibius sp. S!AR15-10 TaxID=2950437 RepID=UPI00285F911C|nr:VCBS repeat-containing protein [Aliifodinibius sp. S!AR15-10]MDR8392548.1 VCBS repeat-containing protein [Aliifodinibius sp. S!AR15-10]